MTDDKDLNDIPPMIPEKDDVASHITNKKAQSQEIVRPNYYTEKIKDSSWPVRVMLSLLTLTVAGGV